MKNQLGASLAMCLALGIAGSALAQVPNGRSADHDAHHPDTAQATPPSTPNGMPNQGQAGMMGQGMMAGPGGMMDRMMPPGMMSAGMQPFRRIEGQLAYMRAELRITNAQAPPWNTFAEAVRTQAGRLRQLHPSPMAGESGPAPAPQQMERRMTLLSTHLDAMRAVSAAMGPLYNALSEEQRRMADELMAEHHRGMRMM